MRVFNWTQDEATRDWVVPLHPLEARLSETEAGFQAFVIDLERQEFLWQGSYTALSTAKRGAIAAVKRVLLGVDMRGVSRTARVIDPKLERAAEQSSGPSPKSIWERDPEIRSHCAWIEGGGLGLDCVVTELEGGGFEGDVLLDPHVFRAEYATENEARHGVLMRAKTLVSWTA